MRALSYHAVNIHALQVFRSTCVPKYDLELYVFCLSVFLRGKCRVCRHMIEVCRTDVSENVGEGEVTFEIYEITLNFFGSL